MAGFSPLTNSGPGALGPAGGDLSGTYPNPSVAAGLTTSKLNGYPNDNAKGLRGGGNWGDVDRDLVLSLGQGLKSQTVDRGLVGASAAATSQTLFLVALPLLAGQTVVNLHCHVAILGSGFTNAWMALYSKAQALLAQSASVSASFTSTGLKTVPMQVAYPVTADDLYFAAVLCHASGAPSLTCGVSLTAAAVAGVGSGAMRGGTQTGRTSLPDPAAAAAVTGNMFWLAVS